MNDFSSILERESKGENKIYLYREGDCWTSYEKSAYKLGKLIDGHRNVTLSTTPFGWLK